MKKAELSLLRFGDTNVIATSGGPLQLFFSGFGNDNNGDGKVYKGTSASGTLLYTNNPVDTQAFYDAVNSSLGLSINWFTLFSIIVDDGGNKYVDDQLATNFLVNENYNGEIDYFKDSGYYIDGVYTWDSDSLKFIHADVSKSN